MQNRPCQDIQDCSLTCGKEQQLLCGGLVLKVEKTLQKAAKLLLTLSTVLLMLKEIR
jgi:hypothetical protein